VAGPEARGLPENLDDRSVLRWRTPLEPGHSSPAITGNRLVLTTFDAPSRKLETVALAADSGRVLWRQPAPATRIETYHVQSGSPACATPASDGERVYVFFGSCGLLCYDLDGRLLWERAFGPFQDEFGAGSSPILVAGKLVLNQDHDLDSFLTALDPRTGKTLWRTPRPDAVRSYSTPAVWLRGGRPELLVAGSLELAGYDPETGAKRWSAGGLARIVIPTPVTDGETVFVASWTPGGDPGRRIVLDDWPTAVGRWDQDKDGQLSRAEVQNPDVLERFFRMDLDQNQRLDRQEWERHAAVFSRAQNGVIAIRPIGSGVQGTNAVRWQVQRGAPYVSSPLFDGGLLWVVKDGGIVTVFEAATGRVLHEERLPGLGNYQASPVAGDGHIYFASEPGTVSIVANRREWQVLSSHNFGEKIHATPLLDRHGLFIRTDRAVYRFQANN
jgi:outer membrane protein assembly factor BamB